MKYYGYIITNEIYNFNYALIWQYLGLNTDDEYDLMAVAQYVRNNLENRVAIHSTLLDAYGKDVVMNNS